MGSGDPSGSGTRDHGAAIYDGALPGDLPESNIDDYVETLLRLRALPVDVVHGGHGDSVSRARFLELVDAYLASKRI